MTPFDWRDFLELADWLDEHPVDDSTLTAHDAALRTVISRAYYAAFHVARGFVDHEVRAGVILWPATRRSIHDKVWDVLKDHPDQDVAALAVKGADLKRQRTEADHSIAPNSDRAKLARRARRRAREIIAEIDARSAKS